MAELPTMITFLMWYEVTYNAQLEIPSSLFRFPESMLSSYYTNCFHIHRLLDAILRGSNREIESVGVSCPDFTDSVLHNSANGLCIGNLI